MKHALGMSAIVSHPASPAIGEQIALYADVGFDAFFLSCGVTEEYHRIPAWADTARQAGIRFEAVHAPTDGVNALWSPTDDPDSERAAQAYTARARQLIDFLAAGGVDKLVLHVAYGTPPPVSEAGLARFAALEAYATAHGVHLCYENATGTAHITAAVQNASPGHGFCHDCGHNACYTPEADLLEACGDRLLFTHIHDNRGNRGGNGDLHLLPFDGDRDWPRYAEQIAATGYRGTLNLELACLHSAAYRSGTFEQFAREAYARIRRLAEMIEAAEADA